jgi:hypothetical protein
MAQFNNGLHKTRQIKIKALMIDGAWTAKEITAAIGLGNESVAQVQKYMDLYAKDPVVKARGNASRVTREREVLRAEGIAAFDKETTHLIQQAGIIKPIDEEEEESEDE